MKAVEGPGLKAADRPGLKAADRPGAASAAPVVVGLGQMAIGGPESELIIYGLGSCVGLALWDSRSRQGALAHIVLADAGGTPTDPAAPAKYANWAVRALVQALARGGARPDGLVAKLVGGAQVLAMPLAADVGRKNVAATLAALAALGIPVRGQETGGTVGRTIAFFPGTGAVAVRPVRGAGRTI